MKAATLLIANQSPGHSKKDISFVAGSTVLLSQVSEAKPGAPRVAGAWISRELGHPPSDSRLPNCFTLPPGVTRTDVSVTLNLYAPLLGPDAIFVLTDRKGKRLAEVKGKTKELTPSIYRIVTEKGIAEIVKLKPYREHENMEQNGAAVALFSVIDDPSAEKELLAAPESDK